MTIAPVTGGILTNIETWVRRIIKAPSTQAVSSATIYDYINRFWVYEVPERIQQLEFRKQYTFETVPNIFQYQAPFTTVAAPTFPITGGPPPFAPYPVAGLAQTPIPVYTQFLQPAYADGVQLGWYQSTDQFYKIFPELVQNEFPLQADGTVGPFTATFGRNPVQRAFVDQLGNLEPYVYITTQNADGSLQYIVDSGQVTSTGLGILIQTDSTFQNILGPVPTNTTLYPTGGSGTVDYINGNATFTFLYETVDQANIETQTSPYSSGFPRVCLYYNSTFKLYPIPDRAYKIQVDAYMNPIVFFQSSASMPFAYMSEYIARGAARKFLSDTGDYEQFQFYEPLFREQENLVLRRSDRQRANMRTPTIYSAQSNQNQFLSTQY
ncbi:hypothetical protein UFOVP80_21 [uncultured Caudovirales phage]|jgi:hypothetical protein|uniref:Uncharacterized protein n=1 Tax=uncultured Caudovirales phage TaxID=2100421 RepID=A0A6J5KYX2_9CAUD|nr:hypothetical protein UFOVP80_21 [uncultured Caudovirales phage]